jgi:hypothetical protein
MADRSEGAKYLLATAVSTLSYSVKNDGASRSIRFLKKVASPFPGLTVAPCVTEDGSSPLAASLLINLGENLSASIVKDLNKQDDLRLSFEYLIAENLVVRLNRKFDGLVHGFLELKCKF